MISKVFLLVLHIRSTLTLYLPVSRMRRCSSPVGRKDSSLQDRILVPTSSELVARIRAFSSLRLTPAMDATSLMSSSSLKTRGQTDVLIKNQKPVLTSQRLFKFILYVQDVSMWVDSFTPKFDCVLIQLSSDPEGQQALTQNWSMTSLKWVLLILISKNKYKTCGSNEWMNAFIVTMCSHQVIKENCFHSLTCNKLITAE